MVSTRSSSRSGASVSRGVASRSPNTGQYSVRERSRRAHPRSLPAPAHADNSAHRRPTPPPFRADQRADAPELVDNVPIRPKTCNFSRAGDPADVHRTDGSGH